MAQEFRSVTRQATSAFAETRLKKMTPNPGSFSFLELLVCRDNWHKNSAEYLPCEKSLCYQAERDV
jgi:hypothetical protein